jgi:peptidoglycan/LPS O-acetylase OafA/YrhL
MYSYSIYLWHGPAGAWFPGLVRQVLHVSSFGANGRFAVYLIGSLVIGITMSKVVEYPVLQLRDRIFPAREGMVVRLSETGQQEASMASKINATVSPV